MKTKNNLFFSMRTAIGSLLWLLLNILAYSMIILSLPGVAIFNLGRGKSWNGEKFMAWPQILKVGAHNRILPYHFAMAGMCYVYILNPVLGSWMISRIFLALVAFECLEIIISYLHKWTDEAGTPLWSSVEYDNEFYYRRPFCGWGS